VANTFPEYFADVAREMRVRSASIRRDFATHRGSAGRNREDLVAQFLSEHLPTRFKIDTGLVISPAGYFSNQADLVVTDQLRNAPLHASRPEKLWPVESVYALLEVKTQLSPTEIRDSLAKCRRFKTLDRQFLISAEAPANQSSLFVLWAYDAPAALTAKANLIEALSSVPVNERPDLVVVPDRFVVRCGEYLELSALGQPESPYRRALHQQHGPDLSKLVPECVDVYDLGENSLTAWFVWFDSWLRHAGHRSCDPIRYLPPDVSWGKQV
jgi:hypothetical protein